MTQGVQSGFENIYLAKTKQKQKQIKNKSLDPDRSGFET